MGVFSLGRDGPFDMELEDRADDGGEAAILDLEVKLGGGDSVILSLEDRGVGVDDPVDMELEDWAVDGGNAAVLDLEVKSGCGDSAV